MVDKYYYLEYAKIEDDKHNVIFSTVINSKNKEKAKEKSRDKLEKVFNINNINGKLLCEETEQEKDVLEHPLFSEDKWNKNI